MAITRHRLLATVELQSEDRFHRLPFDVPPGTTSLSVRLIFDPTRGGVDLGCEGADGWRGWSGGARTDYVITETDATPGYLPGPIEPGQWHVVLGLHRIPADGIPVEVEISVPADRAVVPPPEVAPVTREVRGSDRRLPSEPGLTWYAGDFHGHTLHSDGELPIGGLAALAVTSGLDFMAVTDHNTVSHHAHLPAEGARHGITLLPGQEVTTHLGHANAFGPIGWIDFRRPASEWVSQVADRGGTLSINHPISGDCSWLHHLPQRPAAVELWHSTWYLELISTAPLAWFALWPAGATPIGGSDTHVVREPQRPGTPTTWVAAHEPSPEAILEGLAAGRTAITGDVSYDGQRITPRLMDCPALLRIAGELVAVDGEGLLLVDGHGRRRSVTSARQSFDGDPADGPYYLISPDRTILALSA